MKYCHKCGQKLEDNDIFCDNCGENVADDMSAENPPPVNSENFSSQKKSGAEESNNFGRNMMILAAVVCIIFFAVIRVSDKQANDSRNYNSPSSSSSNSSRNNSSTYNHSFTDNSTGIVYEGVSYDGYSFGVIEITTQKEIYCDFKKSPRASGMFHIVKFAVGNGRNEQILRGQYYLIDDRGRQFGSDINASSTYQTMIGLNPPYEINPGQAVIDFDVFDIPSDVNIVKARYEPFLYDGGIEVPYRVSTK